MQNDIYSHMFQKTIEERNGRSLAPLLLYQYL